MATSKGSLSRSLITGMREGVSWMRGHGGPTASAVVVVASRLLWREAGASSDACTRQESLANSQIYAPFPARRKTLAQRSGGINRRRSHGDPERQEPALHLRDAGLPEVEDRGRERRLRVTAEGLVGEGPGQVVGAASAAGGDHGHRHGVGDRAQELEVVAAL